MSNDDQESAAFDRGADATRRKILGAAAALSTLTGVGGTATADDSSETGDEIDGDHLPSSDYVDEDIAPLDDVTGQVEDAGFADLEISGGTDDDVNVSIIPIREPRTPQDVTIRFSVGDFGSVQLSLAEAEVEELRDELQAALEVPKFE